MGRKTDALRSFVAPKTAQISESDRRRQDNEQKWRDSELKQLPAARHEQQRVLRDNYPRENHRRSSRSGQRRRNSHQYGPPSPTRDYNRENTAPGVHDFQRTGTVDTTSSHYSPEAHDAISRDGFEPRPEPQLLPRRPIGGQPPHEEQQSPEGQPSRPINWIQKNIAEKLPHRRTKSNTNAKRVGTETSDPNQGYHSANIEAASVEGIVDGGDTPPASRVDINPVHYHAYPPRDTAYVQDAPSHSFQDRDLPPPPSLQGNSVPYGNGSIGQQFQLPVMKHHKLEFTVDGEGDASEMEGDALPPPSPSQQLPGSGEDAVPKASRDLYDLLERLKRIEPQDKDLAKCRSAEKAAGRLDELYRNVVNGWTTTYHYASQYKKTAGEVNAMKAETEKLRKENQDLTSRNSLLEMNMQGVDDRNRLRDEMLEMTKEKSESLKNQIEDMKKKHDAAMNAQKQWWEDKLSREKANLSDEIERLAKERNGLQQNNGRLRQSASEHQLESSRLTQEVNRLNDTLKSTIGRHEADDRRNRQDREKLINEKREEMAALEITHMNDTKDLRASMERLEAEKESLQADLDDQIARLHGEQGNAISDLKLEHEKALAKKDEDIKEAEQQLDDFYKDELAKKDQAYNRLKDSIPSQLADQAKRYKDQINALHNRIDDLEAEADKVEDRFRQQYLVKEQRLKLTHQRELNNVKQERENLMGALVERNAFKGIADHVVESRFKKLSKAVDQFARTCTNWDRSREMDWPYPEHVIRSQENPRQMKQYFVQNTIWTTLYDSVFNTPFQPFGDEGRRLYEDWIDAFGENPVSLLAPHWPEATKKTEEWRYDSVQKCMDAVEKPSGDPLLKHAYIQSVQQIVEDILRALSRVMSTSANQQNVVKDIVRQAAKLWLDIGIQRCRILIVVPQGSRGASRRQDGQRTREFIVQPEVQRFGNAQGEGLDTQEVVICKMEVHRLGIR